MRKLKLQMNITVDSFVARPNGELDWMKLEHWDDEVKNCVSELIDSSDTILMGRKMTDDFIRHWTMAMENPESDEYEFAKKMVTTPKVVFTKTLDDSPWANTLLAKGDMRSEVNHLKNLPGKDIVVYGGANFVSSLIQENLIDEYNFFIIPTAIGCGMTLFSKLESKTLNLKLSRSQSYKCGIVANTYLNK